MEGGVGVGVGEALHDDADTPHVDLLVVGCVVHHLRRHVPVCASDALHLSVLAPNASVDEAQIARQNAVKQCRDGARSESMGQHTFE